MVCSYMVGLCSRNSIKTQGVRRCVCRPTIFIEIIERRGCLKESAAQAGGAAAGSSAAGGDADAAAGAEALAETFKDVVQVGCGLAYPAYVAFLLLGVLLFELAWRCRLLMQ